MDATKNYCWTGEATAHKVFKAFCGTINSLYREKDLQNHKVNDLTRILDGNNQCGFWKPGFHSLEVEELSWHLGWSVQQQGEKTTIVLEAVANHSL